ncbi:hypothetical protein [Pseudomonas sp. 18175]|uniref:hypothetical protein n=1 Tax=Pseudomonas sp. 18175 TaxID=3390056 RepID=UPI003D2637DF
MKIIDPISSALLLTGCIYAAGTSQNNSFMRAFGINPEFSQPSIEKTLYDGGLIAFEIAYRHLTYTLYALAILTITLITFHILKQHKIVDTKSKILNAKNVALTVFERVPLGLCLLSYMMFLSFSSFQKGQEDGIKLAYTFIERCHWVLLTENNETTKACAFRKDKDSIWYYQIEADGPKKNSKLLSSSTHITYLEPEITSTKQVIDE